MFLATGFEEVEAIGTADLLLRGGVKVTKVSLTGEHLVKGAHGIEIQADALYGDVPSFDDADALILPGGGQGSQMLDNDIDLKQLLMQHARRRTLIAAVCAAPIVLGGLGLLNRRRATCYPGFEAKLTDAIVVTDRPAVTDGHFITGRGPGLIFEFALEILIYLEGKYVAACVRSDLLL